MPRDLRVQHVGARPALRRVFVNRFTARQVIVLSHALRQAVIDQRRRPHPELLAPFPVFGLEPKNLV